MVCPSKAVLRERAAVEALGPRQTDGGWVLRSPDAKHQPNTLREQQWRGPGGLMKKHIDAVALAGPAKFEMFGQQSSQRATITDARVYHRLNVRAFAIVGNVCAPCEQHIAGLR